MATPLVKFVTIKVGLGDNKTNNTLAILVVGHADDGGLADTRMSLQDFFDQ